MDWGTIDMGKFTQLLEKLKEPSTIKGLVMIAALCGLAVTPEKQEQILVGAGAVYAIIQVFVSKA